MICTPPPILPHIQFTPPQINPILVLIPPPQFTERGGGGGGGVGGLTWGGGVFGD